MAAPVNERIWQDTTREESATNVVSVVSVESVWRNRYTSAMPRQHNPDELSVKEAIEFLGTYRQHFYDLIEAGRIHRQFRLSQQKRAFYLRSELQALKEADAAAAEAARKASESQEPKQ